MAKLVGVGGVMMGAGSMGRRRMAERQVSWAAMASVLVAGGMAAPVVAQTYNGNAFQGQASFNPAQVAITGGSLTDFVTVNAPQAVINWTPTDTAGGTAPINFLPTNGTVTYQAANGAPYAVLNRIIPAAPARPIQFNGTVNSDAVGSVWFYAPGGLILGGGSSFNVGSLVLTAGDPAVNAGGQFLTGGSFTLTNTGSPTAAIRMNTGSSITALSPNSYVVMMAPQVVTEQSTQISVNGSSAIVAAEAAQFTFDGGLFDVAVTSGTSVADAMRISGTVTGQAADGTPHRQYFVAVPKNDAITMSIVNSGQLGFDIAGAADVQGNTVVLSAGYNIVEASSGGTARFDAAPVGGAAANIVLDWADFTSALDAQASGTAEAVTADGPLNFITLMRLQGAQGALLASEGGYGVTVTGDALVSADAGVLGAQDGANRTAGTAAIVLDAANGGDFITITGNAVVSAVGIGGGATTGPGGTGTGGVARIVAQGARTLTIGGAAVIDMRGQGGNSGGGQGGDGVGGGTVLLGDVRAAGGGQLIIGGGIVGDASGTGGSSGAGVSGGDGAGGRVLVTALTGGRVQTGGNVLLQAQGYAGSLGFVLGQQLTSPTGLGGLGTGGTARVSAAAGTIAIGTDLRLDSSGFGGNGGPNGAAAGGTALLETTNAAALITLNGPVSISATGRGGPGFNTDVVTGSSGTGGTAQISIAGGVINTGTTESVELETEGRGGTAGAAGGIGGTGTGGQSLISVNNGQLRTAAELVLLSGGFGGGATTGTGGLGIGGAVELRAVDTGGPGIVTANGVFANAAGGGGESDTGTGGDGVGGTARLELTGVDLALGTLTLEADGFGGGASEGSPTDIGGGGQGGSVTVVVRRGDLVVGEASRFSAVGGGARGFVSGGDGIGGFVSVEALEGTSASLVSLADTEALASGFGGNGETPGESDGGAGGSGGAGTGGTVLLTGQTRNGVLEANDVTAEALGIGGRGGRGADGVAGPGGAGGAGGAGTGGGVNFGVASGPTTAQFAGSATAGTLVLRAGATAGNGGAGGSNFNGTGGLGAVGGEARGGTATVQARGAVVTAASLDATVRATGGNGGLGGFGSVQGLDGAGGAVRSDLSGAAATLVVSPHLLSGGGGARVVIGSVMLDAGADGGFSSRGAGGDAVAGRAEVLVQQNGPVQSFTGRVVADSVTLTATGRGGRSSRGSGGDGTGGTARIFVQGGAIEDSVATFEANGVGGGNDFGAGGSGFGGAAAIDVDGGTLALTGLTTLAARGFGANVAGEGVGGDAEGGSARLSISDSGGDVRLDGLELITIGQAGRGSDGGGDALGGVGMLEILGGTLELTGTLSMQSDAFGGDVDFGTGYGVLAGALAGSATGGEAVLTVDGGALDVPGAATLSVRGNGGAGNLGAPNMMAGNAAGGVAAVLIGGANAGTATLAALSLDATASGGNGAAGTADYAAGAGGSAAGGSASVVVDGTGSRLETAAVAMQAVGFGGASGAARLGDVGLLGGSGRGGSAAIEVVGGGEAELATIVQTVSGVGGRGGDGGNGADGAAGTAGVSGGGGTATPGGDGGDGVDGFAGGAGGEGRGGSAMAGLRDPAAGGRLEVDGVQQDASGLGGIGGLGGAGGLGGNGGDGGSAEPGFGRNGGAGGDSGAGGLSGTGGAGRGGQTLVGNAGTGAAGPGGVLVLGAVTADASGTGGIGGQGGAAGAPGQGGLGGSGTSGPGLNGSQGLAALPGDGGVGGFGIGGSAALRGANNSVTLDDATLLAAGRGGLGGRGGSPFNDNYAESGGNGGDAQGGAARFEVFGGDVTAGIVTLSGAGFGGAGGAGSQGEGTGPGGRGGNVLGSGEGAQRVDFSVGAGVDIDTTAASVTVLSVEADARGTGGTGADDGFDGAVSAGGSARGGVVRFSLIDAGGDSTLDVEEGVVLRADGLGGLGVETGNDLVDARRGIGGLAEARLQGGTLSIGGDLQILAPGVGSEGPGLVNIFGLTGGDGIGGTAQLNVLQGLLTVGEAVVLDVASRAGIGSGGNAGAAAGAQAQVVIGSDGAVAEADLGSLRLDATARADAAFDPFKTGGDAAGGAAGVTVQSRGATLTTGSLSVDIGATGGAGFDGVDGFDVFVGATQASAGGAATGGSFVLGTVTGSVGTADPSVVTLGDVLVSGDAVGGAGGNGGDAVNAAFALGGVGGDGGQGEGGRFGMLLAGVSVAMTDLEVSVAGEGGAAGAGGLNFGSGNSALGGTGGAGAGGSASIALLADDGSDEPFALTVGRIEVIADGVGGFGVGEGGVATGGQIDIGGDLIERVPAGDGTVAAGSVLLSAAATGGDSGGDNGGGAGGDAVGGRVEADFGAADVVVDGEVGDSGTGIIIVATGRGGGSAVGLNGAGGGGTAALRLTDGSLATTGLLLTANGVGGDGNEQRGAASGGEAVLSIDGAGEADFGDGEVLLSARAVGNGATGGTARFDGGDGVVTIGDRLSIEASAVGTDVTEDEARATTGGTAVLSVGAGSVSVAGPVRVAAEADGQAGADVGGAAGGGTAEVSSDGGGLLALDNALDVLAGARAGLTVFADGAAATGGQARIVLDGAGSTLRVAEALTMGADAVGGASEDGVGGSATAGGVLVSAAAADALIDVGGAAVLTADATGGEGEGTPATRAGNVRVTVAGAGSEISLASLAMTTSGDLPFVPMGDVVASGIGGSDGTVTVAGDVTIDVADSAALGIDGGLIEVGGNLMLTAGDVLPSLSGVPLEVPGRVVVAGDIGIMATSIFNQMVLVGGGTTTVTAAEDLRLGGIEGDGDVVLTAGGDVLIEADVDVGGPVTIDGGGLVTTAGLASATTVDVTAVGALTTGDVFAPGGLTLTSGAAIVTGALDSDVLISLDAGASITTENIDTLAALRIVADGDVTVGDVTSGGAFVELTANGGALTGGEIDSAGRVALVADGDVTLGGVSATGRLLVLSRGEDGLVSTGDLAAGQSIVVLAGAGIETGGLDTNDDGVLLLASNAMIEGFAGAPETLIDAPLLRVGGPVTVDGAVSGGVLEVAADDDVRLAGAVTLTDRLQVVAGGTAGFDAVVRAPEIDVLSGDIDIDATFGGTGTETIRLATLGQTAVTLGGESAEGGYFLSAAEMRRLKAEDIIISAFVGEGTPQVRIEGFALQGSAGADPNLTGSSLLIETSGTISVNRPAVISDAGAMDEFRLVADQILVYSDRGGQLAVLGAGGALGGMLTLEARNILVGQSALIGDLLLNINFEGRNARLNAAPTVAIPNAQQLLGGTMRVTVDGTFLVQNSSAGAIRAGFDARSLTIAPRNRRLTDPAVPTGPAVDVVINGQTRNAQGVAVTNNFTLETVTFTVLPERGFTGTTQVNGCVRGTGCVVIPPPEPEPEEDPVAIVAPIVAPVGNDAQQLTDALVNPLLVLTAGEATALRPDTRQEQLVGTRDIGRQEFVEEPVTGAGNAGQFLGAGREFLGAGNVPLGAGREVQGTGNVPLGAGREVQTGDPQGAAADCTAAERAAGKLCQAETGAVRQEQRP